MPVRFSPVIERWWFQADEHVANRFIKHVRASGFSADGAGKAIAGVKKEGIRAV